MHSTNPSSVFRTSRRRWVGMGVLGLALLGVGAAQAGNVYWSIGVHQPGVHVGVSNSPPVVYAPRHVVVTQPPVVVVSPPHHGGWMPPGQRKHHREGHGKFKHRQVTHVHHHHYYTAPGAPVVYAPPIRSHWR